MRIGVISDIHAHAQPLQAALALLDSHAVDRIMCAGDLVDGGTEGDAVVRLLRERQVICVQGNHDRDAFLDQAQIRRHIKATGEASHALLLDSQTTAYVASLPLTHRVTWDGVSLCLAHGTPTDNQRYLFPNAPSKLPLSPCGLRSGHVREVEFGKTRSMGNTLS